MEASLLVGDSSARALRWDLGTLQLQPAGKASPVKQLTAASMPVSHTKPVINHIFVSGPAAAATCSARPA